MTTPVTYTVVSRSGGEPVARGLCAVDAMSELLSSDNRTWDIEPFLDRDGRGWQLVTGREGRGMKPVRADVGYSVRESFNDARADIAPRVLDAIACARISGDWSDYDFLTDAEYDAMVAENT